MVDLFEEALQVNDEITLILASGYNKRVRVCRTLLRFAVWNVLRFSVPSGAKKVIMQNISVPNISSTCRRIFPFHLKTVCLVSKVPIAVLQELQSP